MVAVRASVQRDRLELALSSADRKAFALAADLLSPTEDPHFDHPIEWIHENIDFKDDSLASYQEECIDKVPEEQRVCVRGPHGLGKTTSAALLILWFIDTRERCKRHLQCDWKVVTTASNWRQLSQYLWPEIHKWARRLKNRRYREGTELLRMHINLRRGEAFAAASDDPQLIEGAHAVHILYVFDEAKAIIADTFDAAEGAFSTAGANPGYEAFAFCMSTPGAPNGRFHDIQTHRPGYEDWWVRAVSKQEAIAAGRISVEWCEQRKRQWGEKSSVYQNRVEGKFATQEEDGVIPLDWIEQANLRWLERTDEISQDPRRLPAFSQLGVDVARAGTDSTVLAPRFANYVGELLVKQGQDTMWTAGMVANFLRAYGGKATIDVIGVGAGVVDRVNEQGFVTDPFNSSERSSQTDISGELGFANRRACAWWTLRDALDPRNHFDLALPPDDELMGDLTAPKWKLTSAGKIQVESKDDIKKRLGRSPDRGDGVAYCIVMEEEDANQGVAYYDEPPVQISPY